MREVDAVTQNKNDEKSSNDEPEFISMPPGMANFESATYRMPQRTPPSVAKSAPVFVPAAPGVPIAIPEATEFIPRRSGAKEWRIEFGDEVHTLTTGCLLVGRAPAQLPDWPGATLLAVTDSQKSVSKTHAAFEVTASGALRVHDLASTNGVWVTYPSGDDVDVEPGVPLAVHSGAIVHLGEFEARVD